MLHLLYLEQHLTASNPFYRGIYFTIRWCYCFFYQTRIGISKIKWKLIKPTILSLLQWSFCWSQDSETTPLELKTIPQDEYHKPRGTLSFLTVVFSEINPNLLQKLNLIRGNWGAALETAMINKFITAPCRKVLQEHWWSGFSPGENYICMIKGSPLQSMLLMLLFHPFSQPSSLGRYLLVKIEAIDFGENPANASIPTANQNPEGVKLLEQA